MDLTNDAQVMDALSSGPLKDGIQELMEEISDDIYNIVMSEAYSGGSGAYERTYDLANSVMRGGEILVTGGGGVDEGETGMNPSVISANYVGDGMFNQHMSFNGDGVSEQIIPWFEGELGNSSPYFHGAVHMLRRAYMSGQGKIKPCLSRAFSAYGMKLTG